MSNFRQRIERLEAQSCNPGTGAVFLIQWEGEPVTASHGGEQIEREAGESVEAFKDRAVERFRPAHGAATVWIGTK